MRPFRAWRRLVQLPGALPPAVIMRPFGAEKTTAALNLMAVMRRMGTRNPDQADDAVILQQIKFCENIFSWNLTFSKWSSAAKEYKKTMINYDRPDDKSALQAKFDAQKIAFAPIVFQAAKALRDFGILELIRKQRNRGITAEDIAEKTTVSLYGVKVLLEVGLSSELLRLVNGKYVITKTGCFLLNDELTKINMNFVNDICYQGMFDLQTAIKEEKPSGLKVFGNWDTIYEALSSLPENVQKSWFEFDHLYSDTAFPEVLPIVFAKAPGLILDVGGNTGKWALQCVQYDPEVRIIILDIPAQLKKAAKNVAEHGCEQRIQGYPINLLDESTQFPENADAIWMSQLLDCFSPRQIVSILSRAGCVMNDAASLYILDTYWDRQRFEAAAFSLHNISLYFTCMANGNSKMYHSDEMKTCIDNAGLKIVAENDDIGISHTLFECKLK